LKRLVFLSLSLLTLLILVPGCITLQPQASSMTTPVGQAPVIGTFSSSPSTINPGDTSNLSWNVTGANSVSIDQGIGLVSAMGSRAIAPGSTTVYTISATNATGTVTGSAVAMVNSMPYNGTMMGTAPAITVFGANPSIINSGATSTLSWNVAGANSISIDNGIGQVNASGTMTVSPGASTTYTISATNNNGTITRSTTTLVNSGGTNGLSTGTDTIWH
jgi:hypothetical protein